MVDLLIAVVAVVVLIAVAVVLVRARSLSRVGISAALAVAVVAAGTFGVSLYRSQTTSDAQKLPKVIGSTAPAQQGLGTAVLKIQVPMGTGDKYPQGAMWLQPPRPGTDAYTGDISLLCSTPGKDEKVQNCTGGDDRVWSAEPLEGRVTIGAASGDPLADPAACAESNGVKYQGGYLQLAAGRSYCLHKSGDEAEVFVFRIPSFPAEKPLPARIDVEMSVLSVGRGS